MTINLPKLLVIGSSLPGSKDGGGVVRDEVLKRFPKDKYVCFSTNASDANVTNQELPESLEKVAYRVAPLVPHLGLRGERFYRPILRAIGFHLIAPQRVRQAEKFGSMHAVELVWAELYGDCVVIAQKVAEKLGVPFVGTVWDDLEGWRIRPTDWLIGVRS